MKNISILISTYKSDSHIYRAIDNLKRIVEKNDVEIIWIANDINQFEIEALKQAELLFGSFLKLVKVERENLYASWNRAVAISNSKVLTIYNIDDYRFIDNFNEQINIHNNNLDINILYSSFLINKNSSYLKQQKSVEGKANNSFTNSMIVGPYFSFVKKEIKFVNYFDEQFKVAGDFDFQVRRAFEGEFKKLEKNGGIYFDNSQGLSTSGFSQLIEEQVVNLRYNIKDKIYPFFGFFVTFSNYDPFNLFFEGTKVHVSDICKDYNKICSLNSKIALKKTFSQKVSFYYSAFKFYIRMFINIFNE